MKRPPEKRDGGPRKEAAASMVKRPDDLDHLSKWLRLAELLVSEARKNPLRLHQLEIWIARLRRELL